MIQKQYHEKATGTEVIRLMKNSFQVGSKYSRKYIKKEILRIYDLLQIYPPKAVTSKTICDFLRYPTARLEETEDICSSVKLYKDKDIF